MRKHHGIVCAGLALLIASAGCGSSGPNTTSDKGEEESPLGVDGKADGFTTPTQHGNLTFGSLLGMSMNDKQRFHAATFTLTGEAKVNLSTELYTPNLDTVMYLYRRDAGQTDWGKHVAKNDDAKKGELSSAIAKTLKAGEYQVVVKAFKTSMRGDFALLGECKGSGCPVIPKGECNPDDVPALPFAKGFTATCAQKFHTIVFSESMFGVSEEETDTASHCQLGGVKAKAVGFFRSYWSSTIGWEEIAGDNHDYPFGVEVTTTTTDGGAIVKVDGAKDACEECAVSFVFDNEENLISLYLHDQSPEVLWFCGQPGEAVLTDPDTGCLGETLDQWPHDPDGIEESGSSSAEYLEVTDLPSTVKSVMHDYANELGLPADQEMDYQIEQYEPIGGYFGAALRVTVSTQNKPSMTYYLSENYMVAKAKEGAPIMDFICEWK